jgi:hypothetical protein
MTCQLIDIKYKQLCQTSSDINEHLPTLKYYAEQCDVVVEFGVRWVVSTWAFLAARPKKLISYDFQDPMTWGVNINDALLAAIQCNLDFCFILDDTTKVKIPRCDLLFIDTLHEYEQVKKELALHADSVNKYIIFHDTISFRTHGETGGKGRYYAIEEFLAENSQWKILKEYTNNNGLLIITRI